MMIEGMNKTKVPLNVAKAAYGLQEYCRLNETCDGCPMGRDLDGECMIGFSSPDGGWYVPADWGITLEDIKRLERESN